MSLITCPECGREISSQANSCPNCGCPMGAPLDEQPIKNNEHKSRKITALLVCGIGLLVIAVLVGFALSSNSLKYNKAVKMLEKKQYHEAMETFKKLDDYKDSKELYAKAVKNKMISEDNNAPIISNVPEEINIKVGQTVDLNKWAEEHEISVTDDVSKNVTYSFEPNKLDTSKTGSFEVYISAQDEAENITRKKVTVNINEYATHMAYNDAVSLKLTELNKNATNNYSFKGINISSDEIEWLESGALYRSIAKQLEGFYILGEAMYGNWNSNIAQLVFGLDKSSFSWLELKPYVDEASLFITKNNPLAEILTRIEGLSCAQCEFDYSARTFYFEISDLTDAANELNTTEQMLGYILACLKEYTDKIVFDQNSVTCNISLHKEESPITYEDFQNTQGGIHDFTTEKNEYDIIKKQTSQYYTYYYYDEAFDIYQGRVISTERGVQIGSSLNSVLYAYNQGKVCEFNPEKDELCQALLNTEEYKASGKNMEETCKSFLSYNYNDEMEMTFFFDENNRVSWIVYDNIMLYKDL